MAVVLGGKYTLLRKLGTGGMAEVFLARQAGPQNFEKLVVVKRILPWLSEQPRFVRKFLDEARIAAGLNHKHIIDIYEVGEEHDAYFIVMEFLHGQDLRRIGVEAEKSRLPMPLGVALRIIIDAATGLHFAHTQTSRDGESLAIVHRDVSPHNVMVAYDGAVKVLDFGIAKAADLGDDSSGEVEGKLAYMSPEQATAGDVDARSDQFSLGILLYELTTGTRLFRRDTYFSTKRAVEAARVPHPTRRDDEYPPDLEEILLRSLAKDREDRFESCGALAAALDELAEARGLRHSSERVADYMAELFDESVRGKLLDPEHWNLESRTAGMVRQAKTAHTSSWTAADHFAQDTGSITLTGGSLAVGAPTGDVTLVFTDIEGSTFLWERAPDAMRMALHIHSQLLRDILHETGGYEVKTEGDAFMVAFSTPLAAVRWAVYVQEALLEVDWPEALLEVGPARVVEEKGKVVQRGLRLRMGVHTGKPDFRPDPRTTVMDYFGPDVNRAARVCNAAHGGQIVFSATTWERLHEDRAAVELIAHVSELGEHHLKGMAASERLLQAVPSGLRERRFPPLRTTRSRNTNLPSTESSFVGRDQELERVLSLMQEARLISVTGPAGAGKSRLMMEVGRSVTADYSGGVWLCDLTEVGSLDGMCNAVARVLNIPLMGGASGRELADQLGQALDGRGPLLLILDNFEHLADKARRTIERWVELADRSVIVMTTRIPLKVRAEKRFELPPLPVSQSVELFLNRASAIRDDFEVDIDSSRAVSAIVRKLDGIPLAIELAAARVNVLSPQKILERLDQRFRLLTRGDRSSSLRQDTLFGAIDWSWNLLADWEQSALAQCSVFRGGFSLEAVEEVVDLGMFDNAPWSLDVVQALREKSLLHPIDTPDFPDEARFGMYESIREYAAKKLDELGATRNVCDRHAEYYLGVAHEWAERARHGRARLALEVDNLIAVHNRAIEDRRDPGRSAYQSLASVLATHPLFVARGPLRPHLMRLHAALEAPGSAEIPPALRVRGLLARGQTRGDVGNLEGSRADLTETIDLANSIGDLESIVNAYVRLSHIAYEQGDAESTRSLAEKAVEVAERTEDLSLLARATNALGIAFGSTGFFKEAIEYYERAVRYAREGGDLRRAGSSLGNIAYNYNLLGKFEKALETYATALDIARGVGNRQAESNLCANIGFVHLNTGEHAAAAVSFTHALQVANEIGLEGSVAEALYGLGEARRRLGERDNALKCARRALKAADDSGYKTFAGMALRLLGNLACDPYYADELEPADQYYRKSIEVLSETGERNEHAESLLALSDFLRNTGAVADAKRLRWEALELFEQLGMSWRVERLRADAQA